jgi:hypothetical protein
MELFLGQGRKGYEKQNAHFNGHFIFALFPHVIHPMGWIFPDTQQIEKKKFYWCFTPFIAFKVGAFVK